ncbi:MAG: T9SS type A sorting domain-containing protein [Bacteroidetes bacterium]|nr:T9SS type A sorting domain-containing protein [Bacteroidota bacterium]MBL6944044.1 T9SS type A sorting domain-containing protein [Bacteroidales bacterium]
MIRFASHIIQFVFVIILIISNVSAQSVYINNDRINEPLSFPWAGGMDAVQYCNVDFNLDGIMDLLAFDRRGNRKMCFINNGTINEIDYEYAPQYSKLLPDFKEWVIFADYNMDGKNDIFTYSPGYGSMMVYKNISDNTLKFDLVVYPYLKTLLPGGYVNLFVTSADYPGIADVDNDGDLDILTFGVLGSFIGMHKNLSIEKYGNADSLDYEHTSYCWGHVAESDESNVLYFDTCMPGTDFVNQNIIRKERHTGSTFLVHDLDNNGLVDLLLGDVDYSGLFALYNSGTIEDAYISYSDTLFPQGTSRVNLFSMPVATYTDVNNDNIKDLMVSPFDPGIVTSRNKNSSWLYINSGTNTSPVFELSQTNFLQSEMIDVGSGAYPVIYDWVGDGLKDLFIGNYGYYKYSYYVNYFLYSVFHSCIAYYKNTGTLQNPVFQLWDDDFAGLSSLQQIGFIPAFDDIDGDGDTDLLVGNSDGKIIFVSYNKASGDFDVITENYLSIDVGDYSSPQLFDLNKDGVNDLIIGEKGGNINYYQNFGSAGNPEFTYITDSLGKINVTDYSVSWNGYSTPSFFRDSNQNTGLVVGSEQGIIYYFTNIDDNLDGKFTESDQLNLLLDTTDVDFDRGMRTGVVICDLYSDGNLEMIVGNYSGGLEYFNGAVNVLSDINNFNYKNELEIYPNPANSEVIINFPEKSGIVEITLYNIDGKVIITRTFSFQNRIVNLSIADVSNGVYFIKSEIGNKVFRNKLIVVK